jgi:hypothetical protein
MRLITDKDSEGFIPCDPRTIAYQVGRDNLWGISGGRVIARETGITLPVSAGYSVTIDLHASDLYTVRRIFKRGAKVWIKGEMEGVFCDQVGEVAYYASCYVSHPDFEALDSNRVGA